MSEKKADKDAVAGRKTVPDKIYDLLAKHEFCASEFTSVDAVTFECGIGVNMACKESRLEALREHLMWALFELFKQEAASGIPSASTEATQ
jgi:hypothetical protein